MATKEEREREPARLGECSTGRYLSPETGVDDRAVKKLVEMHLQRGEVEKFALNFT